MTIENDKLVEHISNEREPGIMTDAQNYLLLEINSAVALRREQLLDEDLGASGVLPELVVEILELTGRQHRIGGLHSLLMHRFQIGQDPNAQIGRACRNDQRITSFGKGLYGLAAWRTEFFGDGDVPDKAVRLLKRKGKPLHYQDMYVYLTREVEAGGENPGSSLCSRYRHDPRISTEGGGYYGLKEWHERKAAA